MSVQYNQPISSSSIGDPITQLPVDHNSPSNTEVQIVDTLFRKHRSAMDVIAEESKDAVLVAILVIAFSLSQIDNLINSVLPMTKTSPYILVLVKGIIAAIFYWLIKHFYLSRSST
jgi:hypothetical protein